MDPLYKPLVVPPAVSQETFNALMVREVAAINATLKDIRDNTNNQVNDHEKRIRELEKSVETVAIEKKQAERITRIGGGVLIFLVGIAEFIIARFIK